MLLSILLVCTLLFLALHNDIFSENMAPTMALCTILTKFPFISFDVNFTENPTLCIVLVTGRHALITTVWFILNLSGFLLKHPEKVGRVPAKFSFVGAKLNDAQRFPIQSAKKNLWDHGTQED